MQTYLQKHSNLFTEQNDAEKDALREKIDELKVQRKEFDKQNSST